MEFVRNRGTAFFTLGLLYSVERGGYMRISTWNQAGERIHRFIPVKTSHSLQHQLQYLMQKQNKRVNVKVEANQNNHP